MATYNEINNLDVKTDLRFAGISGTAGQFLSNSGWATPSTSGISNIALFSDTGTSPATVALTPLTTTIKADANYTLSANAITVNSDGLYRYREYIRITLSDATTRYTFTLTAGGATVGTYVIGPVTDINEEPDLYFENIVNLTNGQTIYASHVQSGSGTYTCERHSIGIEKL